MPTNPKIRSFFFLNCGFLAILFCPSLFSQAVGAWGFYGHKMINRLAVFALPIEMIGFYKAHIQFITEQAVAPDRRRYAVKGEAARHYIDVDVYGNSAVYKMPRYWNEAVELHSEDTLLTYGIVPWHIFTMKQRLTKAFKEKNVQRILRLSAELGHYIGDANVPLHTTKNYNGQLTGQEGIHGLWESRLPELFAKDYDFFVGQADYLDSPQETAWEAVVNAHEALDSVLRFERILTQKMGEDRKFGFEIRNGQSIKTYSLPFSKAFHKLLDGQVERRMQAAVKMVADFWYTCWVDAGQPNLNNLLLTEDEQQALDADLLKKWKDHSIKSRPHPDTN